MAWDAMLHVDDPAFVPLLLRRGVLEAVLRVQAVNGAGDELGTYTLALAAGRATPSEDAWHAMKVALVAQHGGTCKYVWFGLHPTY